MLLENRHLIRARADAAAANLRGRVVTALLQLLQEDLKGTRYFTPQPQQQQQQQSQDRSSPSEFSIRAFLEPRVESWPPDMRQYLFANLGQILRFVQQQQQQQQQQVQQQQQQQEQRQQQQEEEPFSATVLRMLGPQIDPARQEASRTQRVLSVLEEAAPAIERSAVVGIAPAPEAAKDTVQFEIYGPGQVSRSASFSVDVWAFLNSQREKVAQFAQRGGQEKTAATVSAPIERSSVLALQLYSAQLDIDQPVRALSWNGQQAWESFTCTLKADAPAYSWIMGRAAISLNGLLITRIDFTIVVGEESGAGVAPLRQTAMRPQTAFASYSSSDRIEVERSAQGLEKGAPYLSVWLDVDSLRSGENWEEKLYAVISTSDIFYLFWSQAAAASKWVDREWRYALGKKGIDFIDPFPLESPQLAPPPSELASLHFNDRHVGSIAAEKQIQAELKAKAAASSKQGNSPSISQ